MFRKLLIVMCLTAISFHSKAQNIRLKDDCQIDTLFVSLSLSTGSGSKMDNELRAIFDSLIADFNLNTTQFKLKADSTKDENSLHVKMSTIDYTELRRNLAYTALNLLFFTGTWYLHSKSGYIIPFLLFPSASSNIEIVLSRNISDSDEPATTYASGNGFWLKKKGQDSRLLAGFEDTVWKIFKKTHRRYVRNIKKSAKN